MKASEFDYQLPEELIAQTPMEPRDHSRLMAVSLADGSMQHRHFYDLPDYLRRGDVLVFNDSRVIPARLHGRRAETGGQVELLLLSRLSQGRWRALVRPGRRMREGTTFQIPGPDNGDGMSGRILQVEADGSRIVQLANEERLGEVGAVPLPPYIHEPLENTERYQTVYARVEGSIAAPTAGLHFTPALLEKVRGLGVETVFVTLHVGWDSFRPVKEEELSSHKMHSEYWELNQHAADAINRARQEGRRVISVGTTAVRLLEQAAALCDFPKNPLTSGSGWARLFITPGYEFRIVDALVTNFHLPRSTLLMLVSAFAERELVLKAYREAMERGYRFFSFGDAMLILQN